MKENTYISLIHRSLDQQLNTADQKRLDNWLQESPENQTIYNEIRQVWAMSDQYEAKVQYDIDEEFGHVNRKIALHEKPRQSKSNLRKLVWYAASAAACFLLAMFVFNSQLDKPDFQYVANVDNDRIELPDGSKVTLAKGSEISYDKDWSKERALSFKGMAFFDIITNTNKPLKIDGADSDVTVLGTKFVYATGTGSKSYLDLYEGKVALQVGTQKDILQASTNTDSRQWANGTISNTKLHNDEYDWCNPSFTYVDKPLKTVARCISLWFDRPVIIDDAIKSCKVTGSFEQQSMEEMLTRISRLYGAEYIKKDNEDLIKGGSCK